MRKRGIGWDKKGNEEKGKTHDENGGEDYETDEME